MKVIVVGAGFGGINAAKTLSKDKNIQVVVIDKRNYHLFQPFLYQVATAGLSPADISVPIRAFFRGQKNVEVIMAEVQGIDQDKKLLKLSNNRTLDYDKVVIAAGAKNHIFNQDWAPYVHGLKSIQDALSLRKKILMSFELAEVEEDPVKRKAYTTFAIIGGGPTGVELAGAIAELARFTLSEDFRNIDPSDTRVILIEATNRVLSTFDPGLSKKAKRALEKLGVSVWLENKVSNICEGKVELGSDVINANTIIWAAGVVSTDLAKEMEGDVGAKLKRGNRLLVNEHLQVVGCDDIYALGDISYFENEELPGIAPVAIQQGKYIGKSIRRLEKGKDIKPFSYKDKGHMATIGRSKAIAQIGKLRFGGTIAWYMWVFIHIYFLIGFRNRVSVFLQWLWSYLTYKRGARIIN
ncbi:MAG: FAD-dependent oxidoreductase [Halobacteriovoraceae bacterium]|nr:FAD-dependent oxidoreductase [Halobacteriovoraceae bacterium]|tara:strand:+ start:119421 stop:120650 length:1230 start_codon:yes stop_codon:yes gene_type:complete